MNIKLHLILLLLFAGFVSQVSGQGITLSGMVKDGKTNEELLGVTILLINQIDSTRQKGTVAGTAGSFSIQNVEEGNYFLRLSFIGYVTREIKIQVTNTDKYLGVIKLSEDGKRLEEFTVEEKMVRVEQEGDTTSYNAGAYKTNPDATVEDLVNKMPGITVENGQVKAHGEDVKRVLIDGEEFFGEDAIVALKNLPAEIVDKIQVFDRMSDQARFTGFNDGEEYKALNIVTKPGMNVGQFGKLYAGYGSSDRYIVGGNVNFFNGTRKISLIGMSNNINQQNFADEDILGVLSTGSEQSRRGRGGRGGGGVNNFMTGQQNGITQTHSLGLNYADKWGEKIKVSGSYFFNNAHNSNSSLTNRQFIIADGIGQTYNEWQQSGSDNFNHRLNMKVEYDIDSSNSLEIIPRLSLQQNKSTRLTDANTAFPTGLLLNKILNDNGSENTGYNLSNDIRYRHKFKKKGRAVSVKLSTGLNNRNGESNQYSLNEFYDNGDSLHLIDQISDNYSDGYAVGTDISFSEQIGKNTSLQLSYEPSYTYSSADKRTNQFDAFTEDYSLMDTLLSNVFDNVVTMHRTGISYRLNKEKANFYLRLNYQHVLLDNSQTFPLDRDVKLTFNNLLPMISYRYAFSKTKNLRLFYRAGTRAPSINQLQNVIDNSNPLFLKSGNPRLEQQYDHRLVMRYNTTNVKKATGLFAFLSGEYNDNFITNATTIAASDTLLQGGVMLPRGSQFSQPVNLQGTWNVRGFITYGIPVKVIKSNLNWSGGASYNVTPGLINQVTNFSNTTNLNTGLVIGSNISEKLDFTFSYSVNYNLVNNSVLPQADNQYLIQNAYAKVNWIFLKHVVVNTSVNYSAFSGLESEFNQNVVLWNAALGYKFLKDNRAELRMSVFDILNENTSIVRNVTESYIEDVETQVLNRYFLVTFTYQIRHFNKGKQAQQGSHSERGENEN